MQRRSLKALLDPRGWTTPPSMEPLSPAFRDWLSQALWSPVHSQDYLHVVWRPQGLGCCISRTEELEVNTHLHSPAAGSPHYIQLLSSLSPCIVVVFALYCRRFAPYCLWIKCDLHRYNYVYCIDHLLNCTPSSTLKHQIPPSDPLRPATRASGFFKSTVT